MAAEGVEEGKVYEGGMIVRTNGGSWWDIPVDPAAATGGVGGGSAGRAPRKLAEVVWPEGGGEMGTWMVMDPSKTQTRMVMVVISVGGTLLTLDEGECIDQVRTLPLCLSISNRL